MPTHEENILEFISNFPGRDDDEIAKALKIKPRQTVNQICRRLRDQGKIDRRSNSNGKIANYLRNFSAIEAPSASIRKKVSDERSLLSEDDVKRALKKKLESEGWQVVVAWGKTRGIDIVATREQEHWVIECKGSGSLPPMQNNYFVGVIGELVQRMSDENAKHSLAFPDLPKFRRLWIELPMRAKRQLGLTCLFVSSDGYVAEALE